MGPDFSHLLDSLGWALLHSLWQGALAALVVIIFRMATKDSQAALRYGFQVLVLIACGAAFAVTFASLQLKAAASPGTGSTHISFTQVASILAPTAADGGEAIQNLSISALLNRYAPLLGVIWCLGVMLLSIRYTCAYLVTQKLRRKGLSDAPDQWSRKFRILVLNAGVRQHVQLFVSEYVRGPLTLGFFKPVVLVPASFFAGLPPEQIEAILLHEIAHIRRHDYLINLLQTAIKTLLFFHPAIHFISRKIDNDREHACDDFAVALTRDPQSLARGLAALRLDLPANRFALAADNGQTPLVARMKRLAKVSDNRRRPEHVLTSVLALTFAASVYAATGTSAEAEPDHTAGLDDLRAEKISHPSGKLGNYKFEVIEKDGRSFTAKIADDGSRWINVKGMWFDVDKSPQKVNDMPLIPVAPVEPVSLSKSDLAAVSDSVMNQYKIDLDYYIESLRNAPLSGPANLSNMLEDAETLRSAILDETHASMETPVTPFAPFDHNINLMEASFHPHKEAESREDELAGGAPSLEPGIYIDGERIDGIYDEDWYRDLQSSMKVADHDMERAMRDAEKARAKALKQAEKDIAKAMADIDRAALENDYNWQDDVTEDALERAREELERAMERIEAQQEAALDRSEHQREMALERFEEHLERQRKTSERKREAAERSREIAEARSERERDFAAKQVERELEKQLKRAERDREHAERERELAAKRIEAELERAEKERERAFERAEKERERAAERAERELERAEERREKQEKRAEMQRQQAEARHHPHETKIEDFKRDLIEQLEEDGYLSKSKKKVVITYENGNMHVNGRMAVSDVAENYCELLDRHDLKKTDSTVIKIKPNYFEFKSETRNGSMRHVIKDHHDDSTKRRKGADARSVIKPIKTPTEFVDPISFQYPTSNAWVSQRYQDKRAGKVHSGIDLAAPKNTPVIASASGVVTMAKSHGNWGNMITIAHGDGYETRYAHLNEICVAEGEQVSVGDNIGTVGSTGLSSGPHLHFEVRHQGQTRNPEELVGGI